jgi:hypothetical protein
MEFRADFISLSGSTTVAPNDDSNGDPDCPTPNHSAAEREQRHAVQFFGFHFQFKPLTITYCCTFCANLEAQVAPFSLQDVLQVTVLPFMQTLQTSRHCARLCGLNCL